MTSAVDTFVDIATAGKASLQFLATSFDASLKGRWREHVVVAYRYMALRVKGSMRGDGSNSDDGSDDEADRELWALLRAVVTSVQAVRVCPRARGRLLSDALCPKPWSSDVLLYVLLAMIDAVLPPTTPPSGCAVLRTEGRGTTECGLCNRIKVFTGSCDACDLSDTQTYICAMALSHECMSRLDFSVDATWDEYLSLERRIYHMVLFTDLDGEIHHTSLFQKGTGTGISGAQEQKKTVLLHSMAAISASMWGRRLSHKCVSDMMKSAVVHARMHMGRVRLTGCVVDIDVLDDIQGSDDSDGNGIDALATMGCDPTLSVVIQMLTESYAEWAGVRFKQAVCKGRCNQLCRAHDTELFGFLSNGVAACGAALGESVEAAFMPVPQVLKSVHGDFDALKFTGPVALHDVAVVLYLANNIIKTKFGISFLDNHVLTDLDMVRNVQSIAAAQYRPPYMACGPGGLNGPKWGVLHWHKDTRDKRKSSTRDEDHGKAMFTPGELLSSDYPLVASLAMWIKLYAQHLIIGEALDTQGRKCGNTQSTEFCHLAQTV